MVDMQRHSTTVKQNHVVHFKRRKRSGHSEKKEAGIIDKLSRCFIIVHCLLLWWIILFTKANFTNVRSNCKAPNLHNFSKTFIHSQRTVYTEQIYTKYIVSKWLLSHVNTQNSFTLQLLDFLLKERWNNNFKCCLNKIVWGLNTSQAEIYNFLTNHVNVGQTHNKKI